MIKIFLLIMLLGSNYNLSEFDTSYKGLVPLKSSCTDVEKLFNVSACGQRESKIILEDETLKIRFSQTMCDSAWGTNWKVEPGTILSIERKLKKSISMCEFSVDWQNLEKKPIESDIEEEFYKDANEGVIYHVVSNHVVTIYYSPTSEMQKLECKKQ